jgi:hypothetical protein
MLMISGSTAPTGPGIDWWRGYAMVPAVPPGLPGNWRFRQARIRPPLHHRRTDRDPGNDDYEARPGAGASDWRLARRGVTMSLGYRSPELLEREISIEEAVIKPEKLPGGPASHRGVGLMLPIFMRSGEPSAQEQLLAVHLILIFQATRSRSGTNVSPISPMYLEVGRISRLSAYCSMIWATQPAVLAAANTVVKYSGGMPKAC